LAKLPSLADYAVTPRATDTSGINSAAAPKSLKTFKQMQQAQKSPEPQSNDYAITSTPQNQPNSTNVSHDYVNRPKESVDRPSDTGTNGHMNAPATVNSEYEGAPRHGTWKTAQPNATSD
jgi:hypothetical protein